MSVVEVNIQSGDTIMKTMLDVRNLLKRFGIFIYTRDRKGDAELMKMEINELYKSKLINRNEFLKATLILQKEKHQF